VANVYKLIRPPTPRFCPDWGRMPHVGIIQREQKKERGGGKDFSRFPLQVLPTFHTFLKGVRQPPGGGGGGKKKKEGERGVFYWLSLVKSRSDPLKNVSRRTILWLEGK